MRRSARVQVPTFLIIHCARKSYSRKVGSHPPLPDPFIQSYFAKIPFYKPVPIS